MSLISERTKHTWVGNGNLGFVKWNKFDPINQLIPISVIPLSGSHCINQSDYIMQQKYLPNITSSSVFLQVRLHIHRTGPKLAHTHTHTLPHTLSHTLNYSHTHTHSVLGKSLLCQNLSFACSAAHTTRTLHWFRPFSLKNFLKTVF